MLPGEDARRAGSMTPPAKPASNGRPGVEQAAAAAMRPELRQPTTGAVPEPEAERQRLRSALSLRSQELLQTRAELHALTDAFPDLLLRLDSDGTILECRAGQAAGPYRLMATAVG